MHDALTAKLTRTSNNIRSYLEYSWCTICLCLRADVSRWLLFRRRKSISVVSVCQQLSLFVYTYILNNCYFLFSFTLVQMGELKLPTLAGNSVGNRRWQTIVRLCDWTLPRRHKMMTLTLKQPRCKTTTKKAHKKRSGVPVRIGYHGNPYASRGRSTMPGRNRSARTDAQWAEATDSYGCLSIGMMVFMGPQMAITWTHVALFTNAD